MQPQRLASGALAGTISSSSASKCQDLCLLDACITAALIGYLRPLLLAIANFPPPPTPPPLPLICSTLGACSRLTEQPMSLQGCLAGEAHHVCLWVSVMGHQVTPPAARLRADPTAPTCVSVEPVLFPSAITASSMVSCMEPTPAQLHLQMLPIEQLIFSLSLTCHIRCRAAAETVTELGSLTVTG